MSDVLRVSLITQLAKLSFNHSIGRTHSRKCRKTALSLLDRQRQGNALTDSLDSEKTGDTIEKSPLFEKRLTILLKILLFVQKKIKKNAVYIFFATKKNCVQICSSSKYRN